LFGLLSFLPLTVGVLFKVQHWPGAGLFLTTGIGATVALFLPTLLYVKIKDSQRKDLNPVLVVGIAAGMVHILGLLFKIMHWPGASLMLFMGPMVFVFVFLPWYYNKVYKEKQFVTFEFIFLLVGVIWFILTSTLFNINIIQ
jgi:hypothetical protein